MAQSYNHITLVGRLTKDPELKQTGNDKTVCPFSIAVDKNDKSEDANFFDCVAWNKTAEFMSKYLKKGTLVLVDGRLDQQVWEKDGQKRYAIRVIVNTLQSLSSKSESAEPTPTEKEVDDMNPDDLYQEVPF